MDECPVPRTVHAFAVPGKPPPDRLVVNEQQLGIQIIKVQDRVHEWVHVNAGMVVRVYCKWCLEVRQLEIK